MQTLHTAPAQFSRAGVIWLKLAVAYLVIGVLMGIVMGATQNFTLAPVHAHINLLGWATLALAGLVYTLFPQAGESRLAKVHFWLINLALPVMSVALAFELMGNHAAAPVLGISSVVAGLAVAAFAANLFTNLK
jgi:hypothetical protein